MVALPVLYCFVVSIKVWYPRGFNWLSYFVKQSSKDDPTIGDNWDVKRFHIGGEYFSKPCSNIHIPIYIGPLYNVALEYYQKEIWKEPTKEGFTLKEVKLKH